MVQNGFDSIELMKEINNKNDLEELGIVLKAHQFKLMNHINKLKRKWVYWLYEVRINGVNGIVHYVQLY